MRIDLRDREGEKGTGALNRAPRQQARRKKRRKKRSRAFEAAIAQPQALSRGSRPKRQRKPVRSRAPKPGTPAGREAVVPAARRRPISWRAVLIRLPALVILVGLLGLVGYASVDARFFVYEARIRGAQHLAAHDIYRIAGVHEQSIFWIRPQQVAERIIQMDGIKAVRVRCDLPAQVYIEVEERQPVIMWRALAQGRDWWLDEEGRVLPYPGDIDSPDMIFVVDASDRQLQTRGRLEPASLVASVQQLAEALPEIRVFYYDPDRGLSFVQKVNGGQWPVYVGTSDDLAYKIQVLQVLIQHLKTDGIVPDYVDVRWPDYAVYHLATGGS